MRNIEKATGCTFAKMVDDAADLITDPELVQNALIKNHIIVSDRLRKETGFEKEQVLEAFGRFSLEKDKRIRAYHSYLKVLRTKEQHSLGKALESKLKEEVQNLIEKKVLVKKEEYTFADYCAITHTSSKYALLRIMQVKVIADVRRQKLLDD